MSQPLGCSGLGLGCLSSSLQPGTETCICFVSRPVAMPEISWLRHKPQFLCGGCNVVTRCRAMLQGAPISAPKPTQMSSSSSSCMMAMETKPPPQQFVWVCSSCSSLLLLQGVCFSCRVLLCPCLLVLSVPSSKGISSGPSLVAPSNPTGFPIAKTQHSSD